jgi:hypothetical protein
MYQGVPSGSCAPRRFWQLRYCIRPAHSISISFTPDCYTWAAGPQRLKIAATKEFIVQELISELKNSIAAAQGKLSELRGLL